MGAFGSYQGSFDGASLAMTGTDYVGDFFPSTFSFTVVAQAAEVVNVPEPGTLACLAPSLQPLLEQLAADAGHARAQFHLGALLMAGHHGVMQNPGEANRYIVLAADQGLPEALKAMHKATHPGARRGLSVASSGLPVKGGKGEES